MFVCGGKSAGVRLVRLQRQHLRVLNAALHSAHLAAVMPAGRSRLHERQQSARGRCDRSTLMRGDWYSHAGNLNVWLVSHDFSSVDIKATCGATAPPVAPPVAAAATAAECGVSGRSSGASRNAFLAAAISLVYCKKTC